MQLASRDNDTRRPTKASSMRRASAPLTLPPLCVDDAIKHSVKLSSYLAPRARPGSLTSSHLCRLLLRSRSSRDEALVDGRRRRDYCPRGKLRFHHRDAMIPDRRLNVNGGKSLTISVVNESELVLDLRTRSISSPYSEVIIRGQRSIPIKITRRDILFAV